MLFEHAILLLFVPFVLFLAGTIYKKSSLLSIGGIGLLVIGIMVLASPIYTQNIGNITTSLKYDNVTEAGNSSEYIWQLNETVEQYNYNGQEFPANDNLMFGIILSFVGLIGLGYGAISFRG